MHYTKPNLLCYRIAQVVSWLVATFVFRRKVLRNEIRGQRGPFVVIANHQAALDFVNLIGLTHRRMSFVISNSFFSTLPIQSFLRKMGVIPKQQFQSSVGDMKRLRAVIANDAPLVIYPAGLMCEDGLSTPIPAATYKFLKWLNADIYVARTSGTYFAMPKWTGGIRPGRTYLDVYKLLSREELAGMNAEEVQAVAEPALLFDAYRDQELLPSACLHNDHIQGLENVLYLCPHCGGEFTMTVWDKHTLRCTRCGYEQTSDKLALLHNQCGLGPELRYVSDWSQLIHQWVKDRIRSGEEVQLQAETAVHMINPMKKKFAEVGHGTLQLQSSAFHFTGVMNGEETVLTIPIDQLPTLPFRPGKYLELQRGDTIFRCVLRDGRLAMKFIHMLECFYELRSEADAVSAVK